MSLNRDEKKYLIIESAEGIRSGIEAMFLECKMHDEFNCQSEDFKSGFELATALIHDAILEVMEKVNEL